MRKQVTLLRNVIGIVLARIPKAWDSLSVSATPGIESQGPVASCKNNGFKRNRRAELKRSARRKG
jgi:hypothetical protein